MGRARGQITRAVTWMGPTWKGEESWQGFPKPQRRPPAQQGQGYAQQQWDAAGIPFMQADQGAGVAQSPPGITSLHAGDRGFRAVFLLHRQLAKQHMLARLSPGVSGRKEML